MWFIEVAKLYQRNSLKFKKIRVKSRLLIQAQPDIYLLNNATNIVDVVDRITVPSTSC